LGNGTGGRASGEDILAVEHDVIPLDWADAFQQKEIDSIFDRGGAVTEDPGDFPRLPVDDARQDQGSGTLQAERSARPDHARLPAALAQAEPRRADSLATSQRRGMENDGSLAYKIIRICLAP